MPPKDKKKAKKAKKAPAYLTTAEHLAPFGLQVGQLVHSPLGCAGAVLGIKVTAAGSELWVRWASGLEAPVDPATGVRAASGAEQLQRDVEARRKEAAELATKWEAYEAEQARVAAGAAKAAAKKKKKKPAADGEEAGGVAAAAAATAGAG